MLPIVVVLFVATSAFAAPSGSVSEVAIQLTNRTSDTGVAFNAGLAERLFELVEEGDDDNYTLQQEPPPDLANLPH